MRSLAYRPAEPEAPPRFPGSAGLSDPVLAGRLYVSPQASGSILQDLAQGQVLEGDGASPLTAREKETLQLITEGHTTAEIAERLFVSVKTVETHRKKIMDKLDLRSVAELTKYAIREGITSVDK